VCANPLSHLSKNDLELHTWVVLAAGSEGFYNYRHQADVCHAYQVIHKMGVPDEHIIVMMKDDIAGNFMNPKQGKIFNEPGGPDVYAGVPKDFTGKLVTSTTFLNILSGEDMTGIGSGKSLKSTSADNVFVFFDDHGSQGSMCLTDGCKVDAKAMEATLSTMAQKKLFKNLVFYVETCFSGSVFYNIKIPANVYITTAAPIGASSFAFNYDKDIGAYLSDIYSYLWIHDTEVNARIGYTFQNQFNYIQNNIENYSQTCQYGDKSMAKMDVTSYFKPSSSAATDARIKITDAVSTFDVPLQTAKRVFMEEPTDEHYQELNKQISIKKSIDAMTHSIIEAAKPNAPHLNTPACVTCDKSCNCYKYCISDYSAEHCEMECCNEESCTVEPPKFGFNPDRDTCILKLSRAFLDACGNEHPYLRKSELLFRRVCKQRDVNVEAALEEIKNQCSLFSAAQF